MSWLCGNCFLEMQNRGVCPECGFENDILIKETNSLDMGTVLAKRYVIGTVLGVGGFSITYKAYDTVLRNIVAIKEYLPNEFSTRIPTQAEVTVYSGDKEEQFHVGQQKFVDEAKKLAKFQYREEIVHIFDCFDENNTSYIVMEYVDGKTIDQMIKEIGKFKVEEAVAIAVSILSALDEVHKAGILHRDISPDNIFMEKNGSVKLIDFGAARYATTSHSKSLSVIIKPGYAPIEQYRSNGDQGPWTDVYGVAATMYKMLTGVTPEDSMERSVKDELQKPSKLGVSINKQTENALMNALNVPIEGRPKTAEEFKNQLLSNKVQRKKIKNKKEDIGKCPIGVKILGGILVAAVVAVLVLLQNGKIRFTATQNSSFMLEEGKTRVPNIVNTDLTEAQKQVESQTLVFVIVNKEYSSEIPKDKVLIQSIDAGSIVDKDSRIEVTVSGGEKEKKEPEVAEDETKVPDTQYKSEEDAIRMLKECGLVAEVSYEVNDTVDVGLVISQDITANQIVKKGDTVKLIVSKEKKKENKKAVEQPVSNPTPEPVQPTPQTPEPTQPAQAQTPTPAPANDGWESNFELEW